MRRRFCSLMVLMVWATACSGNGPELPGWLFEGETEPTSTTVAEPTSTTVEESTSTVYASSSTGPVAECGNGQVEEGEACDGAKLNGATCESVGFSENGLMCVGCQFDVSGCGPPLGMVEVRGGTFEMGSNEYTNEMPIREVRVDRFWIDETEVTVEAYAGCIDAEMCSEPSMGAYCNWAEAGFEEHPVNCVTWSQAEEYCTWAGEGTKRLPTEAEWEKAARGTDAREYPWGNGPLPSCTHVVMDDGGAGCGTVSTWSVGSKPMGDSPYGVHDIAGNVWEWVADWYADPYDATETDNPTGPETGSSRVVRGGSWNYSGANNFRAAHRSEFVPSIGSSSVGFRCASTPPPPL